MQLQKSSPVERDLNVCLSRTSQAAKPRLQPADGSVQVEEAVTGKRACLERRGSHPGVATDPSDIYSVGAGVGVASSPAAGKHVLGNIPSVKNGRGFTRERSLVVADLAECAQRLT